MSTQKVVTALLVAYLIVSPFAIGVCAYKWHDYKDKYVTLKLDNSMDSLDRECDAVLATPKK